MFSQRAFLTGAIITFAALIFFLGQVSPSHLLFSQNDVEEIACERPDFNNSFTNRNELPACSQQLIDSNARRLLVEPCRCPSEPWYWQWQSTISVDNFVYLEVGCNKGYDAVINLRAYTANEVVDLDTYNQLTNFSLISCQIDRDRWRDVASVKQSRAKQYSHYCVEPAKENVQPVLLAAKTLGFDKLGLHVHHAAVSSTSKPSMVKFPVVRPGDEAIGLDTDHSHYTEFYDVEVFTVDQFIVRQDLQRVDVLKIDTEGNDPLVIIGSIKT